MTTPQDFDRLADAFTALEDALDERRLHAQADITIPGPSTLAWRRGPDGWNFVVGDLHKALVLVCQASVSQRLMAAQHMPRLITEIHREYRARHSMLGEAIQSLEDCLTTLDDPKV